MLTIFFILLWERVCLIMLFFMIKVDKGIVQSTLDRTKKREADWRAHFQMLIVLSGLDFKVVEKHYIIRWQTTTVEKMSWLEKIYVFVGTS